MQNSNMRLRLVIRRHALPEVRVVFGVQLENDPTIANLLEQVNEVVPLESTEWGLEDYAVELRDAAGHSFDCMHFQQVSVVLKSDEEVFIRPLVTEDRKKRRLSGRDQISTDGKHLIDGIAFGRPRLRTPRDRPPIEIPPLKRRRITYDDQQPDDADLEDDEGPLLLTEHGEGDDDDDDYEDLDSVRITADFDGLDGPGDMDLEDQDADFDEEVDDVDEDEDVDVEDEPDESELEDELRDLQKENEQLRDEYMDSDEDALPLDGPGLREKNDATPMEAAELDLSTLDKITALRAAVPTAPVSLCEKTLLKCNKDAKKAYNKLLGTRMPVLSLHGMLEHEKRLQSGATARPSAKSAPDAALEEDDDDHSGSDAESVDSLVKHYDQHGFPAGSIMDGSASVHMAETLRKSGQAVKMPVHVKFDDDESPKPAAQADDVPMDDHASDANDEASSKPGSEKGSPSDGEAKSFDDDSDDASDSGPEESSSKQKPEPQGGVKVSRKRRRVSSSDSDSSDQSDSDSDNSSVSGNDSGSDNDSSDDDDDDDDDADIDNGNSSNSNSDSSDDESAGNTGAGDLSSGGNSSDGSSSDSSSDDSDSSSDSDAGKKSSSVAASSRPATTAAPKVVSPARQQSASTEPVAPVPPHKGLTATQRRNARRRAKNKLPKAASDGDLGSEHLPSASTPRAVQDSESIAAKKAALLERLGLVESVSEDSPPKDARAKEVDTPRSASSQRKARVAAAAQEEDPEAWREKISYSAVECCEDDIELSEPPFPFVQRWDPQQRLGKGRGKRKQRNNQDMYEDYQPSPKKRRYADQYDSFSYLSAANEANNADIILNYDDEEPEPEHMETDYAEDAAEVEEIDDLPPLPEDVSTLPLVQSSDVKPGMVLTWKQFLLSKATSWQPQILSLRGQVVDVFGSDSCRVRLAKKDRRLDRNEPTYDEDGTRVYDKFELPVMDEELEEDEALGYRTIDFADIMEPRVLRDEEQEGSKTEPREQQSTSLHIQSVPRALEREVTRSATDLSTTLDHEPSQTEVDVLHAGETAIPETILEVTEEPKAADSAVDISISEERRHEISEMISEAGFRKEVDPSIEQQNNLSSPSRQLDQEMSQERTFGDTTTATVVPPTFGSDVQLLSSPKSHTYPRDHTEAPSLGTTNGTSFRSDYAESQPIILEPFNGFSDEAGGDEADGNSLPGSRVGYPRLDVLHSDGGSVVSGRQPDPGFSFQSNTEDHLEAESREIVPETSVIPNHSGQRELSLVPNDTVPNSPAASSGISSVDSFPSLSEVFVTASTSRSGRAPSKAVVMSAIKARKSAVSPDLGYDEAMRQLDGDDDDDVMFDDGEGPTFDEEEEEAEEAEDEAGEDGEEDGEDEDKAEYDDDDDDDDDDELSDIEQYSSHGLRRRSAVDWLVNKPIEMPEILKVKREISESQGVNSIAPAKPAKNIRVTVQPPPPRPRIPRTSQPSSFMIPPGSNIIEILSSEPEDVVEDYADDSIDEDWNEESHMPNGSGWVGKNYKTHSSETPRRGVSVPAASAPRTSPRRKPSASQSRALGSSRPRKSAARVL